MEGRALVAEHNGAYVLKLVGDVRLTVSMSIDQFVEKMFSCVSCQSVIVDLTEAEGLDSTTLGMLAKMALFVRKQLQVRPLVVTDNDSIVRLLCSMGFEQIFDIQRSREVCAVAEQELETATLDEKAAREKVLQAHQILMTLNQKNRETFKELVDSLCKDC
ncbi:MAG: STAS domain-containing protein [Pseudomonadales bacterium]|nr:STAS domain-containing protein [Pseudomonadales bacterium]